LEPSVIDWGDGVAGTVDEVDEVLAAAGLGEPVRVGDFGFEAGGRESSQGPVAVARPQEDVEVLGIAGDARVAGEGVSPADEEIDPRVAHGPQRIAVTIDGDRVVGGENRMGI